MTTVHVDDSSLQVDSQPKLVACFEGRQPLGADTADESSELMQ